MDDRVPPYIRALSFLRRGIVHVLFRIKHMLGLLAQSVQRDELRELTNEARVLGSASAESINHVGAELREINERLAKLERDVERIGNRSRKPRRPRLAVGEEQRRAGAVPDDRVR